MLEFLYKALASPFGIVLRTSDVERARQKLYAARREACDESLNALGLTPSPTSPDELWIVKKAPNAET
jgi:hypothetical protein